MDTPGKAEEVNGSALQTLDEITVFGEAEDVEILSAVEYYALFDKMPMKALVPATELIKPGGFAFTEDNIHLTPFGSNLVPFDLGGKSVLDVELDNLKEDIGLHKARVPLELATSRTHEDKASSQCAFCGKEAHSKCQNCLCVTYCSRDHQLAHWKFHRPYCKLFEVVQDPKNGNYLVAKSNIKKGEVIILEEPYSTCPYSRNEEFGMLKFEPVSDENQDMQVGSLTVQEFEERVAKFPLVCLGCYTYVGHEAVHTCECGWPVCSKECEGLQQHRKMECIYFKDNMIVFEECRKMAVLSPRIVGIVRALLQKRGDENMWNNDLFDATYEKAWNDQLQADGNIRANVEYLLVTLRNVFRFRQLQYSELCSVLTIIEFKGIYGCRYEHDTDRCRRIIYVYPVTSMIRHRCLGNVLALLTNSGLVHVIASRSIKKGEMLYRNHDTHGDMLHILHRQLYAVSTRNTPCDCQLCVDVNMIENTLSAVLCLKCKRRGCESYMMVETPATVNSSWSCQKCSAVKSNQQMRNLLQDITKDLEVYDYDNASSYENAVRNVIAKYKGKVLHKDHSVILSTEYDLIYQMFNNGRFATLDPEDIDYLIQLLNSRITNLQKFLPKAHSSVVSMKMRLSTVMTHQAFRAFHANHPNCTKVVTKIFHDLQTIYDDISDSFVENTRPNALQGYLMICLRKLRTLMSQVCQLVRDQQHRDQALQYLSLHRNLQNLSITDD